MRKKKNKSGLVSVQVIDKSSGAYKVAKTIGSSNDPAEIDRLVEQGKSWISQQMGQFRIDFTNEKVVAAKFLDQIQSITVSGTELLLGKIFDEIGFNEIEDPMFKYLVLARLSFPTSKLKTTDYLYKYHQLEIGVHSIYRYLDKLHRSQKEKVQQISYRHTLKVLDGALQVVFYDVTTIYFEIDQEDELRKTGFSKEGKHQHPQIVLGLLVAEEGYPLAYEIFAGNKFEGHTMLPVIETFKKKYNLNRLVIIADSGLLSSKNVEQLQLNGYEFILGARLKNESTAIRNQILKQSLKNGQSAIITKDEDLRIIIHYSEARAKKDLFNRERGLKKLEKKVKSGKLSKAHINNRGYNKYLRLEGQVNITIDRQKFLNDNKWDGLKGYITNTSLSKEEIITNYKHLWKIEKAFRIAKTDLKIRPIYHRIQRRIEAHICLNFVAYKVYKELERQLKVKKAQLSPEKAIQIAKTIYSITVETPNSKEKVKKTIFTNEEQKSLANLFQF